MERRLDKRFFRLAHDEARELSDEELVALAKRMPRDRPLNPTEFIQDALARRLIPQDFDPMGYRIHHPELWGGAPADWEMALHFLRGKRADSADWARPFDASFYRELFLPHLRESDDAGLQSHRRANPASYWSLAEALVRNGWREQAWTTAFTHAYAEYNLLTNQLHSAVQELVHFIEQGWRELFAVSPDHEFDLSYYSDFASGPITVAPAEAYRIWVERGLASGAPANAQAHLRQLGLRLSAFPEGFDWRRYLEEHPEPVALAVRAQRTANRWDALEHLVEHGLFQSTRSLPIEGELRQNLLLAAADRFAIRAKADEAMRCYERALLARDHSKELLQHAGDHALRSGLPARALRCYRDARAAGAEGLWTFCNAAKAALDLGEIAEAMEWALGGLTRFGCNSHLLSAMLRIQHAAFDSAVEHHIGALKMGHTQTDLERNLDRILEGFMKVRRACYGDDPIRRPRSSDTPLRVVMLANRDLPQCTFYRVDLKVHQLAAVPGIHLRVFDRAESDAFRSAAATADVAIFYRLASSVEVLRCIAECRATGVPTFYEVDDLIFDATAFPHPLEDYAGALDAEEHFRLRAGVALVRHAVTACDAAVASTDGLAQHLRPLVRSNFVLVHRNGLSESLCATARAYRSASEKPADASVTLFYGSNTRAHGADFRDLLMPALASLMTEFPQVRFIACGHVDAMPLALKFPGRVEIVPTLEDRDAYLAQFLSVDINLAVIASNMFNDCKSEIKWLEAAAFGVPSVVSDVAGFAETLTDGVDVIRVQPDPEAWLAALRLLVRNPSQRSTLGAIARQSALDGYDAKVLGSSLADGLRQLVHTVDATPTHGSTGSVFNASMTVPAQPRRPRVLLCNVFFPPQARGGATRVVRDQAAEMIARYASEFEVGILTGSDGEKLPYAIETYNWSGAPVWSIGCPLRPHMDWLPFDDAMAQPIGEIFDRFQPDLLHAHSIQRLTATLLEQASARSTPYLVTVHDGWWITDHQFFTDDQNRLRMPWDLEQYETEANPHTRAESWARRLRLRRILDGAQAVVAVSEPFAALYRRAGIEKTVAVPNGLPMLPPLEPVPPIPGRVRLAYLGGLVAYKGYFLIRRAFSRGCFRNLELLIADHSLAAGQERQEMWGGTAVRFIGLMPQEQIGKLYGMFDVLLAPSLWPESFGLVAREAMHYGKWVIATSMGSIGAEIMPGENGWVVDAGKPETLSDILALIAADPERFVRSPSVRPRLRCVADQVDELVQLYDKILRRQSRPLDDGRSDIAPGSIIGARRRVSNCPGLVATKPLTSPRPTERARGTVAQAPDPAERALIRASKAAGRLNMADV